MDLYYLWLLLALAIVAFLYSSVGHGGASGYLAVMALAGISPLEMKSSAIVMNLAVSLISFYGFYREGYFKIRLFWPFAIASVPMAYFGGMITLQDSIYKKILAVCLIISIIRLIYQFSDTEQRVKHLPLWIGVLSGSGIGMISGMIGIGGGILLSPLILLMRWATLKETAAVSALFIFVNSLSGLLGQLQKSAINLSDDVIYAIMATILGGLFGSYLGSKKFNSSALRYVLAICLIIASIKLIFT